MQALHAIAPATQGRLGELLSIDSTTLTRTLRPLIRKGWILTAPGADRRENHLHLSSAGKRELRRAQPHWQRAQERLRSSLGGADWDELLALLTRTAQAAKPK